jgi:HAD superfamily hydrolase (TIGR01509 family)
MWNYLLWDHDGVLVDTEKGFFVATRDSLSALGVDMDQATYLRLMAEGRPYWDLARQHGLPEAAIVAARAERDRQYQQFLATEPLEIKGVSDVLRELHRAYRMAIVSTSRRDDFALIHRARHIRQFFKFVITIEDCERSKPAPDPYETALRRFNAHPREAIAIEDSSRGLASALAAGLQCLIIRNAFTEAQDFTGARRILRSIRDLPDALAS